VRHLTHDQVQFKCADVLDITSLRKHMQDVDLVYSAFGILGKWKVPEKTYSDVNSRGVENILKGCLGTNIKQFIHISSAGVLGPLPEGVIADESFPLNPSNSYERAKSDAEKAVLHYGEAQGLPFTIIRPEFVYGPGDLHVLSLFTAVKRRRFFLLGNGRSYLHPTYIDDLIQGIGLCTNSPEATGRSYLITGPRPYTVKELGSIMAEELDIPLPKIRIPLFFAQAAAKAIELVANVGNFDPPLTISRVRFFTENRAFTCEKARTELGYVPQVDFREGVRKTVQWYKENGYL
jgi:nucleoside-diphosphate-sugar epimerase